MNANQKAPKYKADEVRFLDLYPICSLMLAELGRAFIRSWDSQQANQKKGEFIAHLVDGGIPEDKAAIAWTMIAGNVNSLDNGLRSQSSFASSQRKTSTAQNRLQAFQFSRDTFSSTNSPSKARVSEADGNIFSFEDGRWVVRFAEKTIYPQDITGIKYLHFLISSPNQTFSAQKLYEHFGGFAKRKDPKSMSADDAINSGIGFDQAQPDVVIDQRGRNEMLARLEDIETEMARAKLVPNADLIEKLLMERIAIKDELRKAFTPVGSRRIREPELVRRMKAVDIAIRRAKEKIAAAGHHELLAHLNQSVEVKIKSGCRYTSGLIGHWRTQSQSSGPGLPR